MLGWITSYRQVQVVSSIVSTYMPDIWKLNVNKSTQTHFPAQAVLASQPALARRLLLLLTTGVAEPLGITMRRNLQNWCNLVSISKKVVLHLCGGKNLLHTSVYLQNISWSNVFGKFVLIVNLPQLSTHPILI